MEIRWIGRAACMVLALAGLTPRAGSAGADPAAAPYRLDESVQSRSISFENPTGAPGAGGRASSPLGVGRKGAPARMLLAGETVVLADIEGSGTLRHVWMTMPASPAVLRGMVLRAWWDGQSHPSIEAPVGDFFGFAHGVTAPYQSAVHSVGERYGMNFWLPMPFLHRARVTLANESGSAVPVFFQIDYTQGDRHEPDVGRLHVAFRRENPTRRGVDFELLPRRGGRGRYLGAVVGVRPLAPHWWGEGELKIWLDGDGSFPTIAGTGTEDFAGLAWGITPDAFLYHGVSYRQHADALDTGCVSMYRWYLKDPVYWQRDVRVTMQQIGHTGGPTTSMEEYLAQLVERADDWSAASFWYEPVPSAPLPPLPDAAARTADLCKTGAGGGNERK